MAHFYFQARQNNTRIKLVKVGSPTISPSLECSTDDTNWRIWYNDSTLPSGQTLYLRGDNPDGYSETSLDYWKFQITSGSANIGGDIRSLVDVTMGSSIVPVSLCFNHLFSNCTGLVECEESLLSGFTTLTDYCYHYMFQGCTSLTTAPALPATTLEPYCYAIMFSGCTNLTIPPSVLPASLVPNYAYYGMFRNCTSLITAPQINATTLGDYSCGGMFDNCSGLTYIKCLATTLNYTSTSNWVENVSPTGTFVKNPAMTGWTRGNDGIPINWTVEGGLEMNIEYRLTSADNWAQTLDIPKEDTSATGGTLDFYVRYTAKSNSFSWMFSGFTPSIGWTVDTLGSTGETGFPPVTVVQYRLNYYGNTTGAKVTENLLFWIRDDYDQEVLTNSGMSVEQSSVNYAMSASPTAITVDYDQTAWQYIDFSYTNMIITGTSGVDYSIVSGSSMFDDIEWVDDTTKARLRVKCDENETTSVRTGKVRVQGWSVGYDLVTIDIDFTQNAREIHYGTITPTPNSIVADLEDNYYYVSVDYSGFTSIGTVTATTSADWIDLEWQDDETKVSLKVMVDTNYETYPREATITISGTDDWDNTITTYVSVSQPSATNDLYPIWKDVYYTGATDTLDYTIVNEDTNETIYQGRAYVQPNSYNVKINISKIVQGYLNNEIPDGNVINENYGDFVPNAVVNFGIYNTGGTRLERYTYYYDWSYNDDFNGEDGMAILTTPINGHASTDMVCLATAMLYMDGYYVNACVNEEASELGYDLNYCGDYALYYLQRNGGWASFLIEGNSKKTDSYEKYSYNMSFDNTTAEFEESTYHSQITSSWQMNTGWLTDSQADNLAFNLLASNRVFLHDLKKDKIIPVIISNSEAEYKTFKNNSRQMVNYTITLTESQKKQLL